MIDIRREINYLYSNLDQLVALHYQGNNVFAFPSFMETIQRINRLGALLLQNVIEPNLAQSARGLIETFETFHEQCAGIQPPAPFDFPDGEEESDEEMIVKERGPKRGIEFSWEEPDPKKARTTDQ